MVIAVATVPTPGATIDQVIGNVLTYADSLGKFTGEFVGRVNRLLEIAARYEDAFGLYEPFYREFLVTFPPWNAVFTLHKHRTGYTAGAQRKGGDEESESNWTRKTHTIPLRWQPRDGLCVQNAWSKLHTDPITTQNDKEVKR